VAVGAAFARFLGVACCFDFEDGEEAEMKEGASGELSRKLNADNCQKDFFNFFSVCFT
jgi:hypothetical protein